MDTTFAEFTAWAAEGAWTVSPFGLTLFAVAVLWVRGRVAK